MNAKKGRGLASVGMITYFRFAILGIGGWLGWERPHPPNKGCLTQVPIETWKFAEMGLLRRCYFLAGAGVGVGRRWGNWRLGDFAARGAGLEVGVVAFVAGPAGEEAVGEEADVGVIGLDGIVVMFAIDGDAIFGAGEFVLEAEEVSVGFELRIIFDDCEQAADGAVELSVGGDFVDGVLAPIEQGGASLAMSPKTFFFVRGEAFYGGDQVGDEVGAALQDWTSTWAQLDFTCSSSVTMCFCGRRTCCRRWRR